MKPSDEATRRGAAAMKRWRGVWRAGAAGAALALLLGAAAACRRPVAAEMRRLPTAAWDAVDTLRFAIRPLERSGRYVLYMQVRTDAAHPYPFTQLALETRQQWYAADTSAGAPPAFHPDSLLASDAVHDDVRRLAGFFGLSTNFTYLHGTPLPPRTAVYVLPMVTKEGGVNGVGVSAYQHAFAVDTLALQRGMSAEIVLRHGMRERIVEGVTDVGLRLVPIF